MASFRPVSTGAVFWGRVAVITPPKDACFFCGRRLSTFCTGCFVAVCRNCEDPNRRAKLTDTRHKPEAHRFRAKAS